MGHGYYKGGTHHYHSIDENLDATAEKFTYKNGYFGKSSPDSKTKNRNIESDNPLKAAKAFYSLIAQGGVEESFGGGKGLKTKLADGTIISFREISSSDGTPVVEINISGSNDTGGVKDQKIHFVQKEN